MVHDVRQGIRWQAFVWVSWCLLGMACSDHALPVEPPSEGGGGGSGVECGSGLDGGIESGVRVEYQIGCKRGGCQRRWLWGRHRGSSFLRKCAANFGRGYCATYLRLT